jgi:hypothetical protein
MAGAVPEAEWEFGAPGEGHDEAVTVQAGRRSDGSRMAGVVPASAGRLAPPALEVVGDLQRLGVQLRALQDQVPELVEEARSLGVSWALLGWCLGRTGEAVRLRYGADE